MAEGLFKKHDALFAIAAGTFIAVALNVWYRALSNPEMIDRYQLLAVWLARIHEPATAFGERVLYILYPRIGNPWSLRCAVVGAYIVLISMWIFAALVLVILARLIPSLDVGFRKLILLSLVISGAGYIGLAMTGTAVYNLAGMAWSVFVLAIWMVTIWFTLRLYGRNALWLLLEVPVVLLPFYSLFPVGF